MTGRTGSVCSGYEGLGMAVQEVFGGDLAWVADNDPVPARILAHRYPDVPNLGDITLADWTAVEPVHTFIGGYPCGPWSQAGQKRGVSDERHIWPYLAAAIGFLRPQRVILENVENHLRLGFDVVLRDLDRLGYDVHWVTVRASDIGAPHRRARVFVVAIPRHWQQPVTGRLSGVLQGDGTWVEPAEGLFGPIPLTGTLPSAGRVVDGCMYELPAFRPVSQSVSQPPLLVTPTANLAVNGGSQDPAKRRAGGHGPTLADQVEHLVMLPTPVASDGQGSPRAVPGKRTSRGKDHGPRLRDVVPALLPTTAATDWKGGNAVLGRMRGGRMRGPGDADLPEVITALCGDDPFQWRKFEPAIRRWERIFGRPHPAPTITVKSGAQRLSPQLSEWMMGLPEGHVTAVPGLLVKGQHHAIGNGVVPGQAALALRILAGRMNLTAAA
jgi:DNA (cytosine-5)-methyltransferase 1